MRICLFLIFLSIKQLDARLFKLSPFPLKDNATSSVEFYDVTSKVQCGSLCDADGAACKAFIYFPSSKLCQLQNFQLADPAFAPSSKWLIGYVENGAQF